MGRRTAKAAPATQRRIDMVFGPLQFVVLGVRGEEQKQAVAQRLRNLTERGAIRVVDMLYVTKQDDGTWRQTRTASITDEERRQLGTVVGALIGLGYGGIEGARAGADYAASQEGRPFAEFAEREYGENLEEIKVHLRDIAQDLPTGATCAVALIEHQWMPRLREELLRQGIFVLGSGMIRPRSLVMLGRELAEAEQAAP
jgi:hypothetical protein